MLSKAGIFLAAACLYSGVPITSFDIHSSAMPPAIPQRQVQLIPEWKRKPKKKKPLHYMS